MSLTLDWDLALESIDRGQDLFREHWDNSLVFQGVSLCIHIQNAYPTPPDG